MTKAKGAVVTVLVIEQMHSSEFRPSDKCALLDHLNDWDIGERECFADSIQPQGGCI